MQSPLKSQPRETEKLRREGFDGFQINERDEHGEMRRAGERPEYFAISVIEPIAGNEKSLGFDTGADPIRREALDLARDTGKPVATAPIRLAQEAGRELGFVVYLPLYEKDRPPQSIEERRRDLTGFLAGF